MSYQATILADSISPDDVRLTTMYVESPRFLLPEWNTHRMFSRNSNSSRARPTEKLIEMVSKDPFIPETFNKRVKGMGVGEAINEYDQQWARRTWLKARDASVQAAEDLLKLDVDKSRANRLLEPFMWHGMIVTATEWSNFFALRRPPGGKVDINFPAQLEIQQAAILMREAMDASEPRHLSYGEWHLPALTEHEWEGIRLARHEGGLTEAHTWDHYKHVSAGRLARWTSYAREGDYEPGDEAAARCEKLITSFHMSPLEHQARPFSRNEWISAEYNQQQERERAALYDELPDEESLRMFEFRGNLRGWVQFRKEIPNEHDAGLITRSMEAS